MPAGNKKGQIYNTAHKSKNLRSYTKLTRALTKIANQEPLGGRICQRRSDCVYYFARISEAVKYDYHVAYDCPKDCKAYKKRDKAV